jgi:hypothetical protein
MTYDNKEEFMYMKAQEMGELLDNAFSIVQCENDDGFELTHEEIERIRIDAIKTHSGLSVDIFIWAEKSLKEIAIEMYPDEKAAEDSL